MTTTDPFTYAARTEAWRRHPDPVDVETGEPVDDWGFEEQGRRDFQAGAEWARDHLATQEGHRRVRKYADDWDTCTCGYDAWPCRAQEPTDAELAVRELHREVTVYELDSMNGTWVYRDDERVVLRRYCAECSSEDAINAVEDQDWMEDWGYAWEVDYPCPTIRALDT